MSGLSAEAEAVADLIGDRLPAYGPVPAAWWLTLDPDQIAGYDRWSRDYDESCEKVTELAKSIGLELGDARIWRPWGKEPAGLSGFLPPTYMGHWNTELPGYRPIPEGWRIDKKKGLLVPARKTKADRESQANKAFAAAQCIPNVRSYLSGLPDSVYLDDRDFGGTIYQMRYRRGARCVWAYCSGDPDRQPNNGMNGQVDTTIWRRQPLSTLVALMEHARAAKERDQ